MRFLILRFGHSQKFFFTFATYGVYCSDYEMAIRYLYDKNITSRPFYSKDYEFQSDVSLFHHVL